MPHETLLHYRLVGPLGQGAMGEVHLAEDLTLGRRVALKFLPRDQGADPDSRERLRREARALASLGHPNIAAVYALESGGGRDFLVMEYVEGETLAARIVQRPRPVPEVTATGIALAEALAHAHQRGVIHRDVKPANVIVTSTSAVKLTDFGIARLSGLSTITTPGVVVGTSGYMSPEQTRGERGDARGDLFSLGVLLYEALTGTQPFAGDRVEAVLYTIQNARPEPPSARRAGIPPELERIVLKCMQKDPALRYQHAEDLAADLKALQAAAPSIAGPPRRRNLT